MLTISSALPCDVADLAARITEFDALELKAAGITVEGATANVQPLALRLAGELVCLFGAVPHPAAAGAAIPWMLCTRTLERVPRRAMAAVSARVVADWCGRFTYLTNIVHRRNRRAIRFVQWLGFTVGDVPCGPGQEFYAFEWRRNV
ncbi:hypothetical protein [Roseateles aquatilis]|nr:hypothetical protein [Roseateles aquatilis]